ncbi:hypothetical protein ACIBEJ_32875 [Nonomuraea sp. NPDC050790]|uniref:hypothetical protein n=1 Tax=Nonomuraea sp. NPDC050790 TaxID=3364371 RepID=UPI00378DFB71
MTIATLALAGLTAACGGMGQAVDCATMSTELNKISQEFSTAMTGAGGDLSKLEAAGTDAAGKIKTLAGKYDGELASGLNDMAALFEGMKDPAAAAGSMSKIQSAQTKIMNACS